MKPIAAGPIDPSSFEKTTAAHKPLSIISVIVSGGLILLILLFFFSQGNVGRAMACIVAGLMLLNVLFSKRENLTRHNLGLLIFTLGVAIAVSFFNAVQLGRPLAHTDAFFRSADVDFDREQLAYSQVGNAMFKIGLTTEEFEKLVNHYRADALDRHENPSRYGGWGYFELDPSSINRDAIFDVRDQRSGETFILHPEKSEPIKSAFVAGHQIKPGLKTLMEGFPEIDEDLGRCRVIIWGGSEVSVEFYWFEKQQKGYINP